MEIFFFHYVMPICCCFMGQLSDQNMSRKIFLVAPGIKFINDRYFCDRDLPKNYYVLLVLRAIQGS